MQFNSTLKHHGSEVLTQFNKIQIKLNQFKSTIQNSILFILNPIKLNSIYLNKSRPFFHLS